MRGHNNDVLAQLQQADREGELPDDMQDRLAYREIEAELVARRTRVCELIRGGDHG